MTATLAPASATTAQAAPWPRHLFLLGMTALALLAIFHADVAGATRIWWTSTTFGHCLFVAPVIAWLVWTRRREVTALTPSGWWPGLALVALGGFGWLVGDAAGVALARHLGLVLMLQGAVVTLLGPLVARGLLFPLAYAFFLVPFGESLEPPLQAMTVALVLPLLHLVGLAATSDGVVIHAGRYWFEVAEACSGAKFVIAMLAFAVLVANTCFWRWRRRIGFVAAALAVSVLANAVRAFATIWAANLTSVEAATGFDHIVYGWVFFGVVMAAAMALGWRWFDRAPDDPAFDPATLAGTPSHRLDVLPAAALVLAVAALFTAWSGAIAARPAPMPATVAMPDVPGWRRAPLSARAPWTPYYPAADHFVFGRYVDARGRAVDLAVAVFASQREGHEAIAFGTGVFRENDRWVRVDDELPIMGGAALRMVAPGSGGRPVERVVATWYRAGGMTTASPDIVKLATLKARVLGGPQAAVAIHLSAEQPNAAASIAAFAAALGPIDRVADRASAP